MQKISFWSNKLHLSQRDLPIAPDGLYDWQAREDVDDSTEGSSFVTNVIKVVGTVIKKNRTAPRPRHVVRRVPITLGLHLTPWSFQAGFLDLALHPTRQNDRLGAVWFHIFLLEFLLCVLFNLVPIRSRHHVPIAAQFSYWY